QLASAQSNVSIGHGTSPSTGIGDRNVTTVPWPLALRAGAVLHPKLFAEPSAHYRVAAIRP
ncbi:hypothetical protein, partial [Mesorhizobium sp. M0207]|uniref:hypothetical protein n=1 Tax=Mesorhizobium sp. M0207 TaxID=2956915 RepID=UPI003337BFED